MSAQIHPTAIVHPAAKIGDGTRIGAYSIIDADVEIGQGCDIQEHVIVRSFTRLGDEVKVFPFSMLGGAPQHLKYNDEPTMLEVGNRVILRESVTLHRGTPFGRGVTSVGDDCYLMASTHVAHDCVLGKSVIMANLVHLAGHVEIGDFAVIGGQSAVTQFLRVGSHCFIGGGSLVRKDLPPFLVGKGNEFQVSGINLVGLERRGFSPDAIARLRKVYRIFFLQKHTVARAVELAVTEFGEAPEVKAFVEFVRSSKAGIVR